MIKRWDNAGYEQKRPDTITVTLLKDGTVYDGQDISFVVGKTVATHQQNKVAHEERGDEGGDAAMLHRKSHDGSSSVAQSQALHNAAPGYISSIRETGDTFILTNTPEHQKLPQTGLLWWPVPVLAAAGLLLLILGTLLKRKNDHD